MAVTSFVILCLVGGIAARHTILNSLTAEESPACANCDPIVADELLLRIELLKEQILQKLRLTEPPNVSRNLLPRPILDGIIGREVLESENSLTHPQHDDFYAKTTQKIIFLEEERRLCSGDAQCFAFHLPSDVLATEVEQAYLWFYKRPDAMDAHNQTFVVSELAHWDGARRFPKRSPLAIHETAVTEGWVRVGLRWAARRWVEARQWRHLLLVACKTCAKGGIAASPPRQPFIVADVAPAGGRRVRRNINCSAGVTDCCRERLYVDFKDIGWDDWIIYPPGYHAYFCRGTCASAATIAQGSHHNYVIRKYMMRHAAQSRSLKLTPCCTATEFSALQLFYLDSNNTATQKLLPNMIVEACGCM